MKNKQLYILSALFLGACAAPTSSLDLSSEQIDKTGYLFYQNSSVNRDIGDIYAQRNGIDNLRALSNPKLTFQGKVIAGKGIDERGKKAIYELIGILLEENKTLIISSQDEEIITKADLKIDLDSKPVPLVSDTRKK